MEVLLKLSGAIDRLNQKVSVFADWLVLLSALISAGNAFSRYSFSLSSNAWLEIQWYMFGAMILLGASYTLKKNEHVRVDLLYSSVSERTRIWIDILGCLFFLLPIAWIVMTLGWHMFEASYASGEMSNDPGGLIRWPVKLMVPGGFVLLIAQAASEIIKRVAFLAGVIGDPTPRHTLDDTSELEAAIQSHTASVDKP